MRLPDHAVVVSSSLLAMLLCRVHVITRMVWLDKGSHVRRAHKSKKPMQTLMRNTCMHSLTLTSIMKALFSFAKYDSRSRSSVAPRLSLLDTKRYLQTYTEA